MSAHLNSVSLTNWFTGSAYGNDTCFKKQFYAAPVTTNPGTHLKKSVFVAMDLRQYINGEWYCIRPPLVNGRRDIMQLALDLIATGDWFEAQDLGYAAAGGAGLNTRQQQIAASQQLQAVANDILKFFGDQGYE
ncbi:hypothetical protein FRC09_020673 [Ceratobasidium sp. 395]|nr:hypothetical protein FRC09_020673 [Ceratobasidium sp. 395]